MLLEEYRYYYNRLIEFSEEYIRTNCRFRGSFRRVLEGTADPSFNLDYKYYTVTKSTKTLRAVVRLLEMGNYEDSIVLSRTILECYLSERYFDDKFDMTTLRNMVVIPTAICNGFLDHYDGKVTRSDTGEAVEYTQHSPSELCIGKDSSYFYDLYYFMCENAHCNISQAYAFLDSNGQFILNGSDNIGSAHIIPLFAFSKLFENVVLLECSVFTDSSREKEVSDFFVELSSFIYEKLDEYSQQKEDSPDYFGKFAVKTSREMKKSLKEQLGRVDKSFISDLERQNIETSIEKALKPALLESDKPSLFFERLREKNRLAPRYSELIKLIGLKQNPVYHPEVDVWTHTMQVLDRAAGVRDRVSNPYFFMLFVLCHDLGKIYSTEEKDGVIHSYGHETSGLETARKLLRRITNNVKAWQYVLYMIPYHMNCIRYVSDRSSVKATNQFFSSVKNPEDFIYFAKCDKNLSSEDEQFLWERLNISRKA